MRRNGSSVVIRMVSSGLLIVAASAVIATSADDRPGPRPARAGPTVLLVPAYFYPYGERLGDWDQLVEAARSVPLEVIINPANGPGTRRDPRYVAVVDALHRSSARILAYVDTNYGRRALAAIEEDLRRYPRFYEVDGFFIDQMANTPEAVAYYRSIRGLIRRLDSRLKVVGNPGTATLPAYLDAADTLVTFEGSARSFAAHDPRAATPWIAGHPPGRFATIVHGVATPAAGRNALSRARESGAGSVYVTDRKMPNPYLGLPAFWSDQVAAIRAMNEPRKPAKVTAHPATPSMERRMRDPT